MITTKKLRRNIGAQIKEPYCVKSKGKCIKADHVAIAEINAELRKEAMIQKQISAESKRLATELYAGV